MKFSIYIMSVIIFLLVAGAFPVLGVSQVYKGGLMILLLGLISVMSLVCCFKRRPKLKYLGFYLSHLGVVVILAGALVGFIWGKKINFSMYVGQRFKTKVIYDMKTKGKSISLDFDLYLTKFKVERFLPKFTLYRVLKGDTKQPEKIKDFKLKDGKIVFGESNIELKENILKDARGKWKQHIWVSDELVLYISKGMDKWYSAKFHVEDKLKNDVKKTFELAVNHPVSYDGWRFYLMSYGSDSRGKYLSISARKDHGRITVISGIWMLIAGIFIICLLRKNRKEDEHVES